ncbi:MAG: ABC transporter ATP-binding protein [bacterium]
MTHDTAIITEDLGKRYLLGETVDLARDLRETLMALPRLLARRAGRVLQSGKGEGEGGTGSRQELWALRGLNLEVKRGEAVGIIGKNGSGKSTLLKILSRITAPTTGRAEIHGRVGSLLEVGTGMHPELTGRENVFLNGAILGMRRAEITSKFDEIVEFAEIARFIDTPVKRYSSGMRVRLAFAVAAHLELEILMVDEVLAVGDAEFRKKCLGKMENVTNVGRSVLFVSHNMDAISTLCDSAILLENGMITARGEASEIVQQYLSRVQQTGINADISPQMHRTYPPDLEIDRLEMLNETGELIGAVQTGALFSLRVRYKAHQSRRYRITFVVRSQQGIVVSRTHSTDGLGTIEPEAGCSYTLEVQLRNLLVTGSYTLQIVVAAGDLVVDIVDELQFEVVPNAGSSSEFLLNRGLVHWVGDWSQRKL